MGASLNRLLGVDLEGMMKQMAEGLGAALSQGFDAMGQALAGLGTGDAATPADGAAPTEEGSDVHPRAARARRQGAPEARYAVGRRSSAGAAVRRGRARGYARPGRRRGSGLASSQATGPRVPGP